MNPGLQKPNRCLAAMVPGLTDGACAEAGECGLCCSHAGFSVSKSEKASWQPTPLDNRSEW